MKVVYEDLLRFLKNKTPISEVSDSLFQLGHEHEIINNIFDLELTPNRGDCLSLLGIARDLNVFYKTDLDLSIYEKEIPKLSIDFQNLAEESCPKISFLEIEVDEIPSKYEDYLESYFVNLSINKNNFFTDVSNYLSYETGQPTHCFDRKKLQEPIIFDKKRTTSKFETITNNFINLKDDNCVFISNDEVISLAGVMGGKSTACGINTKKVLVECAYFNTESIIGKSIQYNLKSESAHKFERGVDINAQQKILRRFIKIVEDHVNIKSVKMITFDKSNFKNKELEIDLKKINNILGTSISTEYFLDCMKKLGFEVNSKKLIVPSFRSDINNQNDLAEELARTIGYNNIQSKAIDIPKIKFKTPYLSLNRLTNFMQSNGFYEVINFPFTSIDDSKSFKIDNPLDSSKNNLRTNLKDSLINNLLYNERRQKDSIKFFEISNVYSNSGQINENIKIGIIASGRVSCDLNGFKKLIDERYLVEIFEPFSRLSDFKILEISRDSVDTKIKNKIFYLELDINLELINSVPDIEIKNKKIRFIKYDAISEFPSSTRDLSFLVSNPSSWDNLLSYISKINNTNLKEFYIFDFYKNEKNMTIKIGIRLIFQSHKKTLSDIEIQESIQRIIEPALLLDGVSIPGM